MSVPARISLITLGVRDLERATAFYRQLGWRLSSASSDGVSFFHTADSALGLYSLESLADDAALPLEPIPAFRGITLAINMESESEVDRVLTEAEQAGGSILKPAQRVFWGGYSGYFADLDGYAWEVAHNPGFTIRPDGSIALPD